MQKTNKIRPKSYHPKIHEKQVPPTCSTFVNHGTGRILCNVGGYKTEDYFSNAHKKPHATFGKTKDKYNIKNRRNFCYTSLPKVEKENHERRPEIPKEEPIF